MIEPKIYKSGELPTDTTPSTGRKMEFKPLNPLKFYQVEVLKAEFKDNPYYKPDATKPEDVGSKYNINFEFAILDDGEFYGRRLWKNPSPSLMPTTKKGEPTILYKIVTAAMNQSLDWDACGAFATDNQTLMDNISEVVVGKQLVLSIENVTDPDTKKVKSNIKSYNPIEKALPKFDLEKSKAMAKAQQTGTETVAPVKSEPVKPQPDPLGDQGLNFDQVLQDVDSKKKK